MYNPEKRLQAEEADRKIHEMIDDSKYMSQEEKDNYHIVGEIVYQHFDDYHNCFDPEEKEKLRLEGLKMLQDLKEIKEERLQADEVDRKLHEMINGFEHMSQREKDSFPLLGELVYRLEHYDNCFDPEEKEKLRLEGLKMLQDLKEEIKMKL